MNPIHYCHHHRHLRCRKRHRTRHLKRRRQTLFSNTRLLIIYLDLHRVEKTYFVKSLLQNCTTKISPPPERIIWLYKRWQSLYDIIQETVYPKMDFIQGIPLDMDQYSFINPSARNLVILDDLMSTAAKGSRVYELFTEGSHHRNLSVMAINQNLYFNKDPTQRHNCYYLVMFKNPVDQQQVMTLARQMYPGNPQNLLKHLISGSNLQTIRLFSHRLETFYTRTFAHAHRRF